MDNANAGISITAFDGETYLKENPDVAASGVDPWQHYISYGKSEGRSTSTRTTPLETGADAQAVLDVFKGEWSSAMPLGYELKTQPGHAHTFEDARIGWLYQMFGPITGMDVLEIGPLEAGHTYMLHNLGAKSITSIENNSRAYLKCLAIKEIFKLTRASFVLGDAISYMQSSNKKFDIAVASGILYHMTDPIDLLDALSARSDRIFIWTQYFDADINTKRHDAGIFEPVSEIAPGYYGSKRVYPQQSLDWAGFSGGADPYAIWMTRDSILNYLRSKGFEKINIAFDHRDHPNGPAIAICAQRV
ncbi:DUF1698 domain-containing protein [Rhizobium rhizogenes]|uniref:DUF1698 domain-containing protein n=1 Tax=Rhizobium rhizogenes TaxID=359 RepID=UPI0015741B33|nr:DUF1698 domain-containing protein [Rhizobium rhizogenes]NTI22054.1 DUF1698 domain-containing protein [Rhizobium rhizogenes]QTG05657.1 DUF1698 domain-containing protein [Rhizobium rhizogenes]